MTTELTRGELLSRGAKGGAALLVAGSAFGTFAATASAAQLPDGDLAALRFCVGAELLGEAFYDLAFQSGQVSGRSLKALKAAHSGEVQHYNALALAMTTSFSPTPPAVASDFDFAFPRGTFGSWHAIAKFGQKLETVKVGAYLGCLKQLQTLSLASLFGAIAAGDSQHLNVFNEALGAKPLSLAFPAFYTLGDATTALSPYMG